MALDFNKDLTQFGNFFCLACVALRRLLLGANYKILLNFWCFVATFKQSDWVFCLRRSLQDLNLQQCGYFSYFVDLGNEVLVDFNCVLGF